MQILFVNNLLDIFKLFIYLYHKLLTKLYLSNSLNLSKYLWIFIFIFILKDIWEVSSTESPVQILYKETKGEAKKGQARDFRV